ncbi:glycosyltransferase family 2 protein [Candidatus Magnetomonas plexicatena]|uniref:glycosyltransferase family 2 protein n=1 Tax=Candidatus Magnetomonas plexicatena TaxID=2552947 RepID=UPI001C74C4C2|nr:glycosyltransferase [Nitrospirales bacterium LBB_01]
MAVPQHPSVCAVVVTYNRKALLLECLDGIIKQTVPVEAIYLVDNASFDGTPEALLEAGLISELPQQGLNDSAIYTYKPGNMCGITLHYIRMNKNTGGAGGFHEGLKRAYNNPHSWFWLMDDDVEPLPTALSTQLSFSNVGKCIMPGKKFQDGTFFPDDSHFCLTTGKMTPVLGNEFSLSEAFSCKNYGTFEGMLISREVVERVGLPDTRFFYIGDDFVYGAMASLYTNVLMLKEPLFLKKIKRADPKNVLGKESVRLKEMEIYYGTRNRFLIFEYLKKLGTFSFLAYVSVFTDVLRSTIGILLIDRSPKKLFLLYKGLLDGILGRFTK